MTRRLFRLAAVACLLMLGVATSPAFELHTHRIRATQAWEDFHTYLVDLAEMNPDRDLTDPVAIVEGGRMLVEDDLWDVMQAISLVHKELHGIPALLESEAKSLVGALVPFVGGTLDDFQHEIDTFAAANPGHSVKKQQKALDKARAMVAAAADQQYAYSRAQKMRLGVLEIRDVKTFPHVSKPPKKCRLDKFEQGEHAFGTWHVVDFDTHLLVPTWFDANWGSAQIVDNGSGTMFLVVDFGYCDGQEKDSNSLEFDIRNPALGTFSLGDNVGGYHHGPGFGLTLTTQSSVTITTLDQEAGFVGGTYQFVTNNGAGNGIGQFLLRLHPEE